MRSLIKYIILILVVVGIGLVIRNVILKSKNTEDTFINNKNDGKYYQVTVSLLDKDNDKFISGAEMSIETEAGQVMEKWTTKDEEYVITTVPKGKYVLKQNNTVDGYDYNQDDTVFTITDKDIKLIVYNTRSDSDDNSNTGESNTDGSNNGTNNNSANHVNENVGVVDTLSIKNPIVTILGSIITIAGIMLIVFNKKIFAKDEA